jgi:threonylcarbamoyladenosine tRNA methylthiotransferase MtaB
MRMRYYLDSLGCRLNRSEMEKLARQLAGRGCELVLDPAAADVSVLNTCAVTQDAERKSRRRARQIYRANPSGELVLTGCYATLAPAETARLPGVARVVGNGDKEQLVALLEPELLETGAAFAGRLPGGRTRAFVKVQDGCDSRCTYCATTVARGPAISRSPGEVVAEIRALETAGYMEAVLTGVQLGSYGRGSLHGGLHELVATILRETGIPRIRLSSLGPWDLQEKFFELWADERLCRQLHLPLQSGSAEILRRMGRQTTPEGFKKLARTALDAIPDLALTTDMIVGFPGETEADFQASMALVEELDFARLHVFRFSPRPGTAATRMNDGVARRAVQARSHALRQVATEKQKRFLARFAGRTLPVLWESAEEPNNGQTRWRGHSGNYIAVTAASGEDLQNRITPTRLVRTRGDHMDGVVQIGVRHHS